MIQLLQYKKMHSFVILCRRPQWQWEAMLGGERGKFCSLVWKRVGSCTLTQSKVKVFDELEFNVRIVSTDVR